MVTKIPRVIRVGGPTQAEFRLQAMLERRREEAVRIPFKTTPTIKAAAPKPTKKETKVIEKQVAVTPSPPQPPKFVIVGQQEFRGPTRGSVIFKKQILGPEFSSAKEAREFATRERVQQSVDRGGIEILTVKEFQRIGAGRTIEKETSGPSRQTLQRRRIELETIQESVGVTATGELDFSQLTSSQKARVRQITGVKAEKAFTVDKAKEVATTRLEFIKSLESRQRSLVTFEKQVKLAKTVTARSRVLGEAQRAGFDVSRISSPDIKPLTTTTREEFITSLFQRQGFQVTPKVEKVTIEGEKIDIVTGVRAVKPGKEIVTAGPSVVTVTGAVSGKVKLAPDFFRELGTGKPKEAISLALFLF